MRKTAIAMVLSAAALAAAPTTQPVSAPATDQPAVSDKTPDPPPGEPKPMQPILDTKVAGYVAAPQREGTAIVDRIGRLNRGKDGKQAEFVFEEDGKSPKRPPVVILPNANLAAMEEKLKSANADLRFQVTGMLTEYRSHNYLLLQTVRLPEEKSEK